MTRFLVAVVMVVLSGCGAPVTCGEGTQLDGGQCVVIGPDAGPPPSVELPVTALIKPVRVMEGFAACPEITVGYADGRSGYLLLDPDYRVPVPDAVQLAKAGLTLRWVSAGGLVGTSTLTHCVGAMVGEKPGMGTVSLEVSGPDGATRVVGTVMVEVVALPASGVSLARVDLDTADLLLSPTYGPPLNAYASSMPSLALGETHGLRVSFDVTDLSLANVVLLPVPSNLTLTVAEPSTVALMPPGLAKGVGAGVTTISASYSVAGRSLGNAQTSVWVSGSTQTIALSFGPPVADDGLLLPEENRYANTVLVGQCFHFTAVAVTSGLEPGGASAKAFQREVTAQATWSALGSGLTQTAGQPARFCATSEGEAAVRVCEGGVCANLGIVVRTPMSPFATLTATVPAQIGVAPMAGLQRVCVDFHVTAQFVSGPREVAQSVALRFAPSFRSGPSPFYVEYDAVTGTPRFEQGKLCLLVEPYMPGSSLRVFWGNSQAEVSTLVKFQ